MTARVLTFGAGAGLTGIRAACILSSTLGRATGAPISSLGTPNQAHHYSASTRRASSPQSGTPVGAELLSGDNKQAGRGCNLHRPARREQVGPVRNAKSTTSVAAAEQRAELSAYAGGPACRVSGGE